MNDFIAMLQVCKSVQTETCSSSLHRVLFSWFSVIEMEFVEG